MFTDRPVCSGNRRSVIWMLSAGAFKTLKVPLFPISDDAKGFKYVLQWSEWTSKQCMSGAVRCFLNTNMHINPFQESRYCCSNNKQCIHTFCIPMKNQSCPIKFIPAILQHVGTSPLLERLNLIEGAVCKALGCTI